MTSPARHRTIGTYRRNPRGFGFLTPEGTDGCQDVFVSARDAEGIISGDTVSARVAKRGKRDGKVRYQAKDLVLLQRGRTTFVGQLRRTSAGWFIVPDGRTLDAVIRVVGPASSGARAGDQVVVELATDSADHSKPCGTIVRVIGRYGDPGVDRESIVEQYQLPTEFDEDALAEARATAAAFPQDRVTPQREDLRKLAVITIDPPTAKDFDDAVSLTRNADGTTELGVHIADVARFVPAGGALDAAARERSTSVYLADTVIPMLPEALSNGVCSLQERRDRLAKSVFITYGPRGAVRRTRFANSVIRSNKRLTYGQVHDMLEGHAGRTSDKIVSLIAKMAKLAAVIRRRRLRAGMLVLNLPEVELLLDGRGRPVGAEPADTSFGHTMIEMFMVEANEAVAQLLAGRKVTFLRRVHEEPAPSTWSELRRFLAALGYRLGSAPNHKALQEALDHFRHRPEERAVHLAVLRSMQKAHYAPDALGHYALASEAYCHFTSPIRRYPDLTVHRLLDAYLCGGRSCGRRASARAIHRYEGASADPYGRRAGTRRSDMEASRAAGQHCSARERRAEAAERELKLVMLLRLLADRSEEDYDGVVTGVAKNGLFVQLDGVLVEGRLPFDNLSRDRWRGEPTRGRAVAIRTGRCVAVGDAFRVRIARIDLPARQLELALAGSLPKSSPQGTGQSRRRTRRRGCLRRVGRTEPRP